MIDIPEPHAEVESALAAVKTAMPHCSIVCGRVGEDHVVTELRGDLIDLIVCLGKAVAKMAADAEERYGISPRVVADGVKKSIAHAMGEDE